MSSVRNSLMFAAAAMLVAALPASQAHASNGIEAPVALDIADAAEAAWAGASRKRGSKSNRRSNRRARSARPHFTVTGGSPAALSRFRRGRGFAKEHRVCLKPGESLTITGRGGRPKITYRGEGCNQRLAMGKRKYSAAAKSG